MFKPGDLIGEYQLERPLGEGGLGVAWLARRVDRPGAVALKLIRPDRVPATARGAAYDQVSRALTAVGRLEHDSLQPVLGTALGGDGVFGVAAQYLEGGPFERIGDLGRRDVLVQALALVRQLAEVLAWLHSRGLVHGNVKPQNALVTPSAAGPRLVLLDLAWSRAGLGRRTEATRAYVSPEQLTKQAPTFASDQWATARILHQLAMQAAPGASQTQALTALPLPVLRVMKRALEQDPKARFASMESFVQALEFAEEELGSGGSSAHALPTPTLDMLRKAEDVTDRHLPPPRAATPGHPVSVPTPAGAALPQAPSTLDREAPTEPGMLRPPEVREAAVDPSLEQADPTTPLSVQAINPSADRGGSLGDADLVREAPIKPNDPTDLLPVLQPARRGGGGKVIAVLVASLAMIAGGLWVMFQGGADLAAPVAAPQAAMAAAAPAADRAEVRTAAPAADPTPTRGAAPTAPTPAAAPTETHAAAPAAPTSARAPAAIPAPAKAPTPAARTAELPTDDPFAEAKAGCKAGQRQACLDLADAFSGGPTADPGQALVFLGRACDLRATAACEKAGLQLTAAGRDEKRARRYLERACDAGRGRACATLAVLWREGRGGDANPRTADAFERRACQLGYGASCR